MRVIVAAKSGATRERVSRVLSARGFEVSPQAEAKDLQRDGEGLKAEVAICLDSNEWIRAARSAEFRARPYIIAMLSSPNDKSIVQAIASGADDIMPANACAEEVVARVEMPKRIKSWAESSSASQIAKLAVWQDAPRLLSQEVGAMFGVLTQDATQFDASPDLAACIRITCPEDQSEVQLHVGVTRDSAKALGSLAFGAPVPDEEFVDCLREIANTVGGAFKRTANTEGVAVTLGLPSNCPGGQVLDAERVWLAESEDFQVVLGMSLGAKEALKVRASELQPGMVLKHDVRNANGVTLVRAGTALTERTAERLMNFYGQTAIFEVLEA